MNYSEVKYHEECGVFGIFDPSKKLNVTSATYSGLYALQHRGQQSCGIAVRRWVHTLRLSPVHAVEYF